MLDEDAHDKVFHALANRTRRALLDALKRTPGQTVGALAADQPMSRVGVIKHLRVLEDAGLVVSRVQGRKRLLYLNAVPIRQIRDRWMSDYSDYWAGQLTRLKAAAEGEAPASDSDHNRGDNDEPKHHPSDEPVHERGH